MNRRDRDRDRDRDSHPEDRMRAEKGAALLEEERNGDDRRRDHDNKDRRDDKREDRRGEDRRGDDRRDDRRNPGFRQRDDRSGNIMIDDRRRRGGGGGRMNQGRMGLQGHGGRAPPRAHKPFEKVDREKVCPFLLRVFPCDGGHHRESEYISINSVPSGEVHLYTWLDASFAEISILLRNVNESMRAPGVKLSYALVSPNHQGNFHGREVAVLTANGGDGHLTLGQVGLEPGDFLDVAIFPRRRF